MNYFKKQPNQNGFMFIEVVITIAILGLAATALLNLQANVLSNVWQEHGYLEHIFKMQNLFFDPATQKLIAVDYPQVRALEQRDTANFVELKYEILPISSKSELYGRFANLQVVRSTGSWRGVYRNYTDSLVGLVYIAPAEISK